MGVTRLYFRLLGAHLRSMLEYEADFWIMMVGTVMMQVVNVAFLAAIFAKVPTLHGWSFWAVVAMFAMVAIAEGVGSLFSRACGASPGRSTRASWITCSYAPIPWCCR
jgi:ABC-2 type transport system permease protein